jgi:hypothetical protein
MNSCEWPGRRCRIRDAVEAVLSDIILLGTEEQVRCAASAAAELAAGRPVETAGVVICHRHEFSSGLAEILPARLQHREAKRRRSV